MYTIKQQCYTVGFNGSRAHCTAWQLKGGKTSSTSPSHTRGEGVLLTELLSAARVSCSGWETVSIMGDSMSNMCLSPNNSHQQLQDRAGLLGHVIDSHPLCSWYAVIYYKSSVDSWWQNVLHFFLKFVIKHLYEVWTWIKCLKTSILCHKNTKAPQGSIL